MNLLIYVVTVLIGLVMGVLWGTWISLGRSMRSLTAETYLEVGRRMIMNLGPIMRVLMPLTIIGAIAQSVVVMTHHDARATALSLTILVLIVVMVTTTLLVNVPIDFKMMRWTETTMPLDWEATRRRWEIFHTLRTFVALAAFVLALALLAIV